MTESVAEIFQQPWFGVIWAILGILLGAAATLRWAKDNGYSLGKRIAQALPGDHVEKFMYEFLMGFMRGLHEGMNEVAVDVVRDLAAEKNGVQKALRIELKANPLLQQSGSSGSAASK